MSMMVIFAVVAIVAIAMQPAYAVGTASSLTRARDDMLEGLEEFNRDESVYIAEKVAPVQTTDTLKGVYTAIKKEDGLADEGTLTRNTDGSYPRMTISVAERTYDCTQYGISVPVDSAEVANLRSAYNLPVDEIAGRLAWNRVRRRYEARVAAKVQSTTLFTGGLGNYTDVSGTNPWATSTSKIIKTITDAVLAIAARGYVADSIAMSHKQWLNMMNCDQFAGRVQYVQAAAFQAIADFLAPAIGLRNLFVARSIKNTTAEGGSFSGSRVWNDSYVNVFASGQLIVTKHANKVVPQLIAMEEYDDPDKDGRVIRVKQAVGELMVDALAGQLLKVE